MIFRLVDSGGLSTHSGSVMLDSGEGMCERQPTNKRRREKEKERGVMLLLNVVCVPWSHMGYVIYVGGEVVEILCIQFGKHDCVCEMLGENLMLLMCD
jgi:hypothetical protein